MNPTLRFVAALTLCLATLPLFAADTAIDQLFGQRAYELADAYWAAGQRFAALGQKDRAAEFQAKAKRLFPGYVPGQAPAASSTIAPPAVPQLPVVAQVREQNLQGQKIARLQFQKLLRGYLTGSPATLSAVLEPQLVVQGQAATASVDAVTAFLTEHPAAVGSPDELFLSGTLDVADGPGQVVVVSVEANPDADLAALLPFWKAKQTFTFDRRGETWKLVSVEGRD